MHTRFVIVPFCRGKRLDFGTNSTFPDKLMILFNFNISVQLLNKLNLPSENGACSGLTPSRPQSYPQDLCKKIISKTSTT